MEIHDATSLRGTRGVGDGSLANEQRAPQGAPEGLDVEILHVEGVVFDKFAARFDVLAHERGEDGLGFGDVFKLDRSRVRRSGSMVVSQSCVAVISPRPL